MKFLGMDKVVCLSPHPDDVEYSLSGTVLKYYETTFYVLSLTKGGAPGFDVSNEKFDRRGEVDEFWKRLKTTNVKIIHSDCDYLTDKTEPGWINYIENIFFQKESFDDIVEHEIRTVPIIGPGLLIPSKEDSQFEHRFVNKLGYGLIRSFPISLIEYKTVSTLTEWNPNFTVNITSEYIRKVEAMKAFVSQKDKTFLSDTVLEQFHTDYRLSRRGIRYSEQFKILECFE